MLIAHVSRLDITLPVGWTKGQLSQRALNDTLWEGKGRS